MFHSLALLVSMALFSSAAAQSSTWDVAVSNVLGDLVYNPPYINASVGDTVRYNFFGGGNHTVTQSTLATPCDPLSGGFDSGFIISEPGSGAKSPVPNFNVTVTSEEPIYVYCRQGAHTPASHCIQGMVMAVNPGNTFLLFQARAEASPDH